MKKCRFLSILCTAALLMSMAVLPGCQSNQGSNSAAQGSGAQKEAPTLTWWLIGGGTPNNLQSALAKINDYTSKKINVKLNIKIAAYGDWDNKMNQIVNSGEKFDIMFTNNTKYSKQVDLGAFADLTDLVKSDAPNLYKAIPEEVWKGTTINGKIYAVPTYKDSAIAQYWAFDDKYVKKYNIDVANTKTFDALDKAFTKIKQGEGKSCYPLKLTQSDAFAGLSNDYDDLTLGFTPIGVRIDDKNHKVVSVLEQSDEMEKLKMLHKWYQQGIINPDAPTTTDAGKGLIFMSAQAFPGAEAAWQVNQGVAKYDTVPVADPIYSNSSIQGSLNAISANSDHKTEALKLLELINTDHKLRDMIAYGEEGKNFQYVKPNVVKKLSEPWELGSYAEGTFFTMSTLSDAPADQWDQIKKQNAKAISSACLGFTPDVSKISTELANCQAVWDKYRFELMTGASDPTQKVPQIVKELKSAGMDTIISELQSQLDGQLKAD